MNVTTGVTAFQTFHFHLEEEISGGNFYLFIRKFCNGVNTSGTSDKDFSFIFRIEVQKGVTAHKTFLQGKSSGKPRFFVYGKQTFQRTMFDAVVSQDSQLGSYTDTVVGSEGSAFGFQPFTVNFSFDGIGEEVMLNIVILFAHHVDMRLQNDGLKIFFSRSSGLFNQYITGFIHLGFEIMFCSECLQVGNHFLFLLRRAWHLADFFEILEYASRL